MNTNKAFRKPAPAWMFYLFFAFFFILGVSAAIRYEHGIASLIGGIFIAFLGTPFLLEPLSRINKLPGRIDQMYRKVKAFFKYPKITSPSKLLLPALILNVGLVLIFILDDGIFGKGWPAPRIYLVTFMSFIGLFIFTKFTYTMIQEWKIKSGKIVRSNFLEEQLFLLKNMLGTTEIDTTRAALNIIITTIPGAAGFFVSICIPQEKILFVIPLIIMAIITYGQSAIFSREMIARLKIESELRTAHDMQMGLMPKEDPKIEGFDISGICLPANEVGGDFFDYVWLNDAKSLLGIAVADVSGKAMKAAITAVMTSGMVYREVGTNDTPKSILRKINRPMYLKTDKNVFTALSFAIIDLKKNELTFSNAGQMMPLLRRGETLRSIKVEGPRLPLGVQEVVDYDEITVRLQSNDILILFTDGVVEAKNIKEELWGFERMEQAVRNLPQSLTAKEMGETLFAEANKFARTAKQHDDMTIVVVRVL
jgi:serine phosphatase RsbU (regulator of sigma subunit)